MENENLLYVNRKALDPVKKVKCNLDPSHEIDEKIAGWWVIFLKLRRHDPIRQTYHETERLEYFASKGEYKVFRDALESGAPFLIDHSHVQVCLLVNDPEKIHTSPVEITPEPKETLQEERLRLKNEIKAKK